MNKSVLAVILLFSSSSAFSIGVEINNSDELLGCWKRVIYSDEIMKQMNQFNMYDPKNQKYQWFCFFENERFHVMTSNNDDEYTTRKLRDLFKNMPKLMTWKWVQNSVVMTEHKESKDSKAHWLITRIDKDMYIFDNNLIPKDSLFMAIPTQDLKSFVITRVLVRV